MRRSYPPAFPLSAEVWLEWISSGEFVVLLRLAMLELYLLLLVVLGADSGSSPRSMGPMAGWASSNWLHLRRVARKSEGDDFPCAHQAIDQVKVSPAREECGSDGATTHSLFASVMVVVWFLRDLVVIFQFSGVLCTNCFGQ